MPGCGADSAGLRTGAAACAVAPGRRGLQHVPVLWPFCGKIGRCGHKQHAVSSFVAFFRRRVPVPEAVLRDSFFLPCGLPGPFGGSSRRVTVSERRKGARGKEGVLFPKGGLPPPARFFSCGVWPDGWGRRQGDRPARGGADSGRAFLPGQRGRRCARTRPDPK